MKLVKFTKKGIYCIPGNFYLDPWFPVDYAIISHGHADHARWGNKHYLCHNDSKAILKHRIGKDISIESLAYNQPKKINGAAEICRWLKKTFNLRCGILRTILWNGCKLASPAGFEPASPA